MIRIAVVKNTIEFPLVFKEAPVISMEEFESLFELDTAIKGGFSIGLEIPRQGNENALDFAHVVATRNTEYFFDVRIYEGSRLVRNAVLVIDKVRNDWNSGDFDTDIVFNSFGVLIKDVLLKDTMNTEVVLGNDTSEMYQVITTDYVDNDWPEVKVNFPMLRLENEDLEGYALGNRWDRTTNSMIETTDGDDDYDHPILPQVYLAQAVKECFEYFGYTVKGDIFDDKIFSRTLIAGYMALQEAHRQEEIEYRLGTTQTVSTSNTALVWDEVVFENVMDTYENGTPSFPEAMPTDNIIWPSINSRLIKIQLHVIDMTPGATISIYSNDSGASPDYIQIPYSALPGDVIEFTYLSNVPNGDFGGYNNRFMLKVSTGTLVLGPETRLFRYYQAGTGSVLPTSFKVLRNTFKTGECVPPTLLISDFLTNVKKGFQVRFLIDEVAKSVEISSANVMLKSKSIFKPIDVLSQSHREFTDKKSYEIHWANEHADISEYNYLGITNNYSGLYTFCPKNSVVLVLSENAYYFVESVAGAAAVWKRLGEAMPSMIVDNGGEVEEVNIGIYLVSMRSDELSEDTVTGVLPTLYHSEKLAESDPAAFTDSSYITPQNSEWKFQLMMYYNRMNNGPTGTIPFASSAAYKWSGDSYTEGFLYLNNRSQSLFMRNIKDWLTFLGTQVISKIQIPIDYSKALQEINNGKIYWQSNIFLVKSTTGELGSTEEITEIEMVKL